jgi:DNA-directed RNA polymerase subunit M/transcription elongation factor TFIIS
MKFCKTCENMYYIKIDDNNPNSLNFYCRNCGEVDTSYNSNNITINKTQFNKDCLTNTNNKNKKEIIYIRYDDINIKYVYLCSTCQTVWKSN